SKITSPSAVSSGSMAATLSACRRLQFGSGNTGVSFDRRDVRFYVCQIDRTAVRPPHVACARIGWRLRLPREVARRPLLAIIAQAEGSCFLIDGRRAAR